MARLGPVSSLDPSCRLICLALASSSLIFSGAPLSALLSLCFLILLFMEGQRPAAIIKDTAFVAALTLFILALRFFGTRGALGDSLAILGDTGEYGLRLLAAFLAGRLFYLSTTSPQLRDAATRLARRMPLLGRTDIGLGLALILGLVPVIFDEWASSLEAARSRGMPRRPGLSMQALFVAAFLRRLMLRSVATPEALFARGWSRERGLPPSTWRARDSLAALACLSLFLGVLLLPV